MANPDLTWRDVQHILIETAEKNDPSDIGWTTNAAGYDVHYHYGFGRVDALAAITAAQTWTASDTETYAEAGSSPDALIPDNDADGLTDVITIPDDICVEFAEVTFDASDHTYWPDLEVTLTSPAGTQSILAENKKDI